MPNTVGLPSSLAFRARSEVKAEVGLDRIPKDVDAAPCDALTGLPGREWALRTLRRELSELGRNGQRAALLLIDLDDFRSVSITLGQDAADQLIVETARRLMSALDGAEWVARTGTDEFLVLLRLAASEHRVDDLGLRLLAALDLTLPAKGLRLRCTASVGVSAFPRDGQDIDALMRCAGLALHRAKALGRHRLVEYDDSLSAEMSLRVDLMQRLHSALEKDQFEAHYQPKVDMLTGEIVGVEALVRWRHPTRGLLGPEVFMEICESSGLISAVGRCVFEQAARQQVAWRAMGFDLEVAINLSPRQFEDSTLIGWVKDLVSRVGCDPARLEVEITESLLLGHGDETLHKLNALRAMGFRVAIDDFGTGYSNLAYLRRYPLDTLKIDRAFVCEIGKPKPLAKLIISMCRSLDLRMVAEGVEREEQRFWLASRGVHQYQGYLFSLPLPAHAIDDLLRQQTKAPLETDPAQPSARSHCLAT